MAADLGFKQIVVPGLGHYHVVFLSAIDSPSRLHVYLDGDGRPWVDGQRPASDPTSANPYAMRLMAADAAAAAYVGRPCYFGRNVEPECTADLWTFARYSEAVVASTAAAINRIVSAGSYRTVVLIGYSGGGALARLVAPDIEHLVGVLTIAANLDTDAWTDARGFLPLVRSLNPANAAPLHDSILHVAVVGERDTVVPPVVVDAYLAAGQRAEVWRYSDADHVCCWREHWSDILAKFESRLTPGEH